MQLLEIAFSCDYREEEKKNVRVDTEEQMIKKHREK